MGPWLFARDSATIPALFKNLHYETHPRLWYLILYGVSRLTRNPVAMQATNLLIIGSAMTLFVCFCPLPFYLRALTVLNYYFVYEWGTISRNYALGVLLCFAFCARYPKRDKGCLGLAAILFLATQSNHYAALLAAALGGLLIFEAWTKPDLRARIRVRKLDAALSLFLVYGGVLLAFWIGIPQPDANQSNFSLALGSWDKVMHAFTAVWDGFVPLPEPTLLGSRHWDMTGHFLFGSSPFPGILGMILFAVTILFFWRSRPILWAYLAGAGLLLLLAFVKIDNYTRHTGHFFLWFLICLWLAHYFPDSSASRKIRPFKLSLYQILFFCPLLLVHIYDSAFLSIAGYYYPFSCSKAVAVYIEQHGLKGLPILGYRDWTTMPVSGYLDVPIYYLNTRRWGSFIIEDNKRQSNLTGDELVQAVNQFASQGHQDFLLLVYAPLQVANDNHDYVASRIGNLHEEASFYPAIQDDEIYWLYRYKAVSPPILR